MKTNREKLSEVLEKRGYKNEDLINEIEQIYNKQQLHIHGVVASVLCVDSKEYNFITLNSKYELVKEGLEYMTIYDNDGDLSTYEKECFKKI